MCARAKLELQPSRGDVEMRQPQARYGNVSGYGLVSRYVGKWNGWNTRQD